MFRAVARAADKERKRHAAELLEIETFANIIERAQGLDRQAGRPIKQDMTLEEALARLEEAEDQ